MHLRHSRFNSILIFCLTLLIIFTFGACKNSATNSSKDSSTNEKISLEEETTKQQSDAETERASADLLVPTKETIEDDFCISIMGKTFSNEEAKDLTVYFTEVEIVTTVEPHTVTYKGYRLSEVFEHLGLKTCDIDAVASDEYTMMYKKKYVDDPNTMLAIYNNDSTRSGPFIAPCSVEAAPMYIKLLTGIEAHK
jgi:hypothetical protein